MQAEGAPACDAVVDGEAGAAENQGLVGGIRTDKTNGSDSSSQPPTKKQKSSKEAEDLLNASTEKSRESKVLQQTPEDLLAAFRQLARNPQDAQREDDDSKSALLEVLKLRHEYATHPEGWVARKKRITRETAQRWGVTDSGALCSRVGPNYQVVVPDFVGTSEYEPNTEIYKTSFVSTEANEEVLQSYLASLEPLYKQYVLNRRMERTSYRDMGTFREFALEKLSAASFNPDEARKAVEQAMNQPAGWEEPLSYEVWSAGQSRNFKTGSERYKKNFSQIVSKSLTDKPIKALISFYYRSKHVDGACRRGPVLLVGSGGGMDGGDYGNEEEEGVMAPKGPDEGQTNNWLQMRCECRRWIRVNEQFRHLYQLCQDCEKVLCSCPSCCTAVVLPTVPGLLSDGSTEPEYACPNCSHIL